MPDPKATDLILTRLQRNIELCQDDLEREKRVANVDSQNNVNAAERALNDAIIRREWAKQGVPL